MPLPRHAPREGRQCCRPLKTAREHARISRNDAVMEVCQDRDSLRSAGRYNCELFPIRYSFTSIQIQRNIGENAGEVALQASLQVITGGQ